MDDGSIIPFAGLVLEPGTAQLVPRATGPSEGTGRLRALADAAATLRAYASAWRHFDA